MILAGGAPLVWWSLCGLFVGSFLNVAIHRWPLEDQTVFRPRRSRCPSCGRMLGWRENVPVLSWLFQLGRCRGCKWRIPIRYPLVELTTALLWVAAWYSVRPQTFTDWVLVAVYSIVLSALVVAAAVDLDRYEIPDEVSIGGIVAAPVVALLLPELHAETALAQLASGGPGVDRFGALVGCAAGMAAGAGALWAIGWIGKRIYGSEAMGLGDVKLLAAGGGFVGPGGAMAALFIAALVASVVGLANMARFFFVSRGRRLSRGGRASFARSLRVARVAGRYLPFGPYLALGIGIVLLRWNDVATFLP